MSGPLPSPAVAEGGRPTLSRRRRIGGEGEPEVFCADEQHVVALDLVRWRTLAEQVLAAEGVRGAAELSLLFVDASVIAELNAEYLAKPGPTDVLAFPIDVPDIEVWAAPGAASRGPDRAPVDVGELPLLLGDVIVCPEIAAAQAPTHAGEVDDELALLVVHGVLHVLGWDHAEPDEREAMRARERELLERFHWAGPSPAGFRQEHPE